MLLRRRTIAAILGTACFAAAIPAMLFVSRPNAELASSKSSTHEKTNSTTIGEPGNRRRSGFEGGSAEGFERVRQRFMDPAGPEGAPRILSLPVAEIADSIEDIASSYDKLSLPHRAQAFGIVAPALQRLTRNDVAADWFRALGPIETLLKAGFSDQLAPARANAAASTIQAWSFLPGRAMIESEENLLDEWKIRIQQFTIKALKDPNPVVRAAAIASLGANPTESGSLPALVGLNDPEATVRAQTILSFGDRPDVLTIETVMPRLHDRDAEVRQLAEKVLKRGGLTTAQMDLARLVSDQDSLARASAIDRLMAMGAGSASAEASSIDPEAWMLHLSQDPDDQVRMRALEGLARLGSPAIRKRIEDMAAIDPSSRIRASALKFVPSTGEAVPAKELPPLPDAAAIPASTTSPSARSKKKTPSPAGAFLSPSAASKK